MKVVTLREINAQTVRAVCALKTKRAQKGFVAPNAWSIAQAYFEPAAQFRAVHAGDTLVGFVMWRPTYEEGTCFLWRFMIAGPYQRKGYGRRRTGTALPNPSARGLSTGPDQLRSWQSRPSRLLHAARLH